MIHANANRMKEPTCCGCCTFKTGAIALIVRNFIAGISDTYFGIYFGIPLILGGICGIGTLTTKKKRWAVATAVMTFMGALMNLVQAIMIFSGVELSDILPEELKPDATVAGVQKIFLAVLEVYWGYFWIQIGKYFEQNERAELVIGGQNPNYPAMNGQAQQDPRYGQPQQDPRYGVSQQNQQPQQNPSYGQPQHAPNYVTVVKQEPDHKPVELANNKQLSTNQTNYV